MKSKTNRQVLTAAIKNLSDFELVILRERILSSVDEIVNNQDDVRESMKNHIISPDLFITSCQNIKTSVDFK
jgi:hypothetical protein